MAAEDRQIDSTVPPYRVRYTRRRSLGVYVYRDGRVEARAPIGCPPAEVEAFVTARLPWIRRKLEEFAAAVAPAAPRYCHGEPHPFLGRDYPLALFAGLPREVRLAAGALRVRDPGVHEPARVRALLLAWYRREAERILPQRLEACLRALAHWRLPRPKLRIRAMRTRWGSCSQRGDICLNVQLVKYPERLIDYVVVHELCHLREFNHSPRFYALMDEAMPDWPMRKAELNRLARGLAVD